jgi:Outer membrane protein beta-barrel domain
MRKIILALWIACLSLLSANLAFAQQAQQRKTRIGLQAGPNLCFVSLPRGSTYTESRPRLGYDVQAMVLRRMTDHFGIQASLGTSRLGYRTTEPDWTSSQLPNNRTVVATRHDQVLYLAALARFSLGAHSEKFFFTIGPVLEQIFGRGGKYVMYDGSNELGSGTYRPYGNQLMVSAQASAGWVMSFGPSFYLHLEPYFRYHHIDFSDTAQYKWRRSSTGIRLGFWF